MTEPMHHGYSTPTSNAYNSPNSSNSNSGYPNSPYGTNPAMYNQGH